MLGSAKGWAASIIFNQKIREQFAKFFARPDTFSLGVCNGCQLMALIGWVGTSIAGKEKPDILLEHNNSERFECRWSTVKIENSKAIMLKDMEGWYFTSYYYFILFISSYLHKQLFIQQNNTLPMWTKHFSFFWQCRKLIDISFCVIGEIKL